MFLITSMTQGPKMVIFIINNAILIGKMYTKMSNFVQQFILLLIIGQITTLYRRIYVI